MNISAGRHFTAIALSALLLFLSYLLFDTEINRQQPDIILHSRLLLGSWGPEIYSHILYFFLLELASGFSHDIGHVNTAAIVLLCLFTLFKYLLLLYVLVKFSGDSALFRRYGSLPALLAFLLCIVHPIPLSKFPLMLGYLPSNNWHNSTTIILAPLALLQFYLATELLKNYSAKQAALLAVIIGLSSLAKPNFFLVFTPAYLLLLFHATGYQFNRRYFFSAAPVAVGCMVLAVEYRVAYSPGASSSIGVSPFLIWNSFSAHKWWCLLSSVAFPLIYLAWYAKEALKDKTLVFSWLLVLLAILVFILFYEKGPRMYHGNFLWQVIPAMQILFLATLANWLRRIDLKKQALWQAGNIICLFFFLLHVAAGGIYIWKIWKHDIL